MGNSQKGLRTKVRQLFSREENQLKDPKPGNVCPKCHIMFPKASADIFLLHLQHCQQSPTQLREPNKIPELPHLPEKINTSSETLEHVFEKVPTNPSMTQFNWTRVPVVYTPVQLLLGYSPEIIAKRSFQQKLAWMRACLESMRIPWQRGSDTIKVEKDNVLMTSISAVSKVNMFKEVKIQFADDKVNDAGGLLREWTHMITKEIFGEAGIFQRTNTNEVMYKIKWDKDLDVQFATDLFGLFGTVLGKSIFQKIPLTCYLDRTLIRQLCGQKVNLEDISGYDKDFYKNWKYLLVNQIEPFGQYFSVLKKHGDNSLQVIQLVPGGDDLEMDESNKKEFVRRCIDFYCTQSISQYITTIKKSLHKIVPQKILSVFEPYQMQMILYGVPFVNVNDWKKNTEYKGTYSPDHKCIRWFWGIVEKMTQTQLCNLLHFVTGSSRIPIYGFQKLESNRGTYGRMLIQSIPYSKTNPYPQAHTCFNRLDLPLYPSQDLMKTYLMAIVNSNLDGVYGLD